MEKEIATILQAEASLCMNQETRERTIEAIRAVVKLSMENPGTSLDAP